MIYVFPKFKLFLYSAIICSALSFEKTFFREGELTLGLCGMREDRGSGAAPLAGKIIP